MFPSLFQSYADYEHLLASSQLILAMLGMGALLAPRDFLGVVRSPRALTVGLFAQLLLVPLIAALLGEILPLQAGIAAGLVLVSAVPGGTMSNVITYLGRGNIALSIALTAICTLAALVVTPLILRVFIGAHLPPAFEMPIGRIAAEIGFSLLLPLAAGMGLGAARPRHREVFSRWCIRGSLGVIGLMVIGAAGSGRLDVAQFGVVAPLAILLFSISAQAAAWLAARASRLERSDRLALVVEVTVRNTNLALLLKASLFPAVTGVKDPIGDGMFFVALLYGGVALLVVALPVMLNRRLST